MLHRRCTRRNVGLCFQHCVQALLVRQECCVCSYRSRKSKKIEMKRQVELLDLVQLGALDVRYPSQLSGSQRQSGSSRRWQFNLKVLLLDEPFGAFGCWSSERFAGFGCVAYMMKFATVFVTPRPKTMEVSIVVMNSQVGRNTGSITIIQLQRLLDELYWASKRTTEVHLIFSKTWIWVLLTENVLASSRWVILAWAKRNCDSCKLVV